MPRVVPAPGRDHFGLEGSGRSGCSCKLVTATGEFILFGSSNPILGCQIFGGQAHVHDRLAVFPEQSRGRIVVLGHRDMVHVFDAAGQLDILATGHDAHCRIIDRLQARCTIAINRDAPGFDRQPGHQQGDPGDVESLFALLLDTAPANVLDERRVADPLRELIGRLANFRRTVSQAIP